MTDYFFTLGGGQFWEDLLVENHWRIQRNLSSSGCRLLDKHNIIRAKGNFDDCLKEWQNYQKAYDMPKMNKHLIICLHSFARTRKIFDNLLKISEHKNIDIEAIDYPSMQRGLKEQVAQLNTVINNFVGKIETISFVTYGSGNVLLEKLLAGKNNWQQNIKLGRIVEVAPMIKESSLLVRLMASRIGSFILGPMAKELKSKNFAGWHKLPKAEIGAVCSKTNQMNATKEFCGAKLVLKARIYLWRPFNDKSLCESVLKFIQSGTF